MGTQPFVCVPDCGAEAGEGFGEDFEGAVHLCLPVLPLLKCQEKSSVCRGLRHFHASSWAGWVFVRQIIREYMEGRGTWGLNATEKGGAAVEEGFSSGSASKGVGSWA
ncbi:exo-alpha-sialidase [Trypanosoma cruzi]|nr:exo-alpha-sialidase [Trypanosoma cruzi]